MHATIMYDPDDVQVENVFAIWPGSGIPPGSENWTWHEQSMQAPQSSTPSELVRNVVIPTITMFKPDKNIANGTAIIVAPGGAFHFLMMDHEGYDVARWLTELGVTALDGITRLYCSIIS